MSDKQRIGIMGGTFDPIHIGHLVTAEAVRREYQLEKVLFIPAADPPHKQNLPVTLPMHRYIMTILATYSNIHFAVSRIELDRKGPSYTIDTITELKKQYGLQTELFFITGTDAILELATWKNVDLLLENCHFIAATRPGCGGTLDSVIEYFGEQGRGHIHLLATPELDISSTDIRERVKQGRSIKYIVPENVENYIAKEGLYRT
ncbi:putative nicotinate-nucleotide adenylyltransferase [Propionispora sp. 2/2-37]|uniref:nicotinate-nucleotide adenylyltransferase n=1 Tax=Propionispora sp. 2/2-37 TaxID=1677858 RepID=UPI0006BB684E|nr:nicotinate-nucleotide adenylyltransferase [Propionispora sp. 2/2-37]CUH97465.1 putative nicotinate-nucleotide adenylyltransferase [Propionispora sp. 2/2-37]